MRPKSLSATALQVANLCLARYQAEHIIRGRAPGKSAATLGSAVHGALELYVKATQLEKTHEPSQNLLIDLYKMSFMSEFGTADTSSDEFEDGREMLLRWFMRTDFSNRTVLSCEVKENFSVPTSIGEIPYNYIWDRFDQTGPREVTVVDYKTNRWNITSDDLGKKVQPRCYALAAAIKAKAEGLDVDTVWVEFDMLRHDRVGRVFTREQNAATWKFIKDEAERIIAAPDDPPETPNSECVFCVRLQTCSAVASNALAGGILGLDFDAAIDRRAALAYQVKALSKAVEQLDEFIMTEAKGKDIIEYETDMNKLAFKVSSQRGVDGERVEKVVGAELFNKYGGLKLTMGQFDKLMKDPNVTPEQKAQLKGLVGRTYGEPRVDTSPRSPIDDES
jgi:RecB family exonuclease